MTRNPTVSRVTSNVGVAYVNHYSAYVNTFVSLFRTKLDMSRNGDDWFGRHGRVSVPTDFLVKNVSTVFFTQRSRKRLLSGTSNFPTRRFPTFRTEQTAFAVIATSVPFDPADGDRSKTQVAVSSYGRRKAAFNVPRRMVRPGDWFFLRTSSFKAVVANDGPGFRYPER